MASDLTSRASRNARLPRSPLRSFYVRQLRVGHIEFHCSVRRYDGANGSNQEAHAIWHGRISGVDVDTGSIATLLSMSDSLEVQKGAQSQAYPKLLLTGI